MIFLILLLLLSNNKSTLPKCSCEKLLFLLVLLFITNSNYNYSPMQMNNIYNANAIPITKKNTYFKPNEHIILNHTSKNKDSKFSDKNKVKNNTNSLFLQHKAPKNFESNCDKELTDLTPEKYSSALKSNIDKDCNTKILPTTSTSSSSEGNSNVEPLDNEPLIFPNLNLNTENKADYNENKSINDMYNKERCISIDNNTITDLHVDNNLKQDLSVVSKDKPSNKNSISNLIKTRYRGTTISVILNGFCVVTGKVVFNFDNITALKLKNNTIVFINNDFVTDFF